MEALGVHIILLVSSLQTFTLQTGPLVIFMTDYASVTAQGSSHVSK